MDISSTSRLFSPARDAYGRRRQSGQITNPLQRNPVPPKSGIMPNFAAASKHEMKAPDTNCHIEIKDIGKDARTPELVAELLDIWEASVRASHHFLTEADIRNLRPQAEEAIQQIETLWTADHDNSSIGFMGIQTGKIEMLFLHPGHFRNPEGILRTERAVCRRQRAEPRRRGILRTDGLPHIPARRHRRPGQSVPHPADEAG